MSSHKKNLLKTVLTGNGRCGCSKTKSSEVHEPTPKSKSTSTSWDIQKKTTNKHSSMASSTTSVDEEELSSTTISESEILQDHNKNKFVLKQSPLVNSVAIEKDSSNPYNDFRHSMLQMIFEKEMESEEDLQHLLQCFLQLNAPCHHHLIVKAFHRICKEAFPNKVSTTPALLLSPSPRTN
ncbi:hypothetical protein VNO78_05878 [Psophocarpus tetragonolobus]|uniref:Transcription repressor n=1 Tax=Psophocarpus tetragonolobus TaxID=3891 RepID=A0AAN9SRN5_PSOTE